MSGRARNIDVPPDARALSTLDHIDYEDGFLVETDSARERTAEEWARAMLEGAPKRDRLRWAWFALGLKHGSPQDRERVLGWQIRRTEPDVVLLGAESRTGMPAELLLLRRPRSLFFATFVQKNNPIMRAIWAGIEREHQRVVPALLARAASAVEQHHELAA